MISTPKAENDRLAELVFAARIVPAGNDRLNVRVAASEPGRVLPRMMKYFPLEAGFAKSVAGITIKLYDAFVAD